MFARSQRAVENREKRRKLVVKSPAVPQRPPRLRDRYEREKELRTEEHTHQSHKKKFLEHYGQTGTTPG